MLHSVLDGEFIREPVKFEDFIDTEEYAITGFKPMRINKRFLKYKLLSKELGEWHSKLMKEKLYPKAYKALKNSGKWYCPEIHYDAKRIGGAFLDERQNRDGSYENPYGIVMFTRSQSMITDTIDVLFEEVMHAMLHRYYTTIKIQPVNLLYEETAMRVLQAYANVYHPKEYSDHYMKGYINNQAVKTYFQELENGNSYTELDKAVKDQYLKAFDRLKDAVWRHYIARKRKSTRDKNPKSSISPEKIEGFIQHMIN